MQKPCLYVAVSPVAAITKIAGWFLCVCCTSPFYACMAQYVSFWRKIPRMKSAIYSLQFVSQGKKVFLLQISQKNQLTADTPKRPAASYKPDTQYTHISLSLTIFYPWRKIERIWKFFKMYSERLPGFFLWKECCIVERNHRKQTKIRKSFFPENEFSELESTFGSIHRKDMSRDKTSIDCICVSSIIS